MLARNHLSSLFSKIARTRTPVYILSAVAVIAVVAWAKSTAAVTATPTATESAITPALTLAAGTLKLEGSDQQVDAASAAKLLPLWQLLAQLQSSSATAPQEISAIISEIQLNMTASQLKAINAMSFTEAQLNSVTSSAMASSTQVAGSAAGAVLEMGMFAGGGPGSGPMDGGPMPGGGLRSNSSSGTSASSSTSASPSLIDQVIQLLAKKVQG